MERVCKTCGESFELSQGEIDFYKSKDLNMPKRCSKCRKAGNSLIATKFEEEKIQPKSKKSIVLAAKTLVLMLFFAVSAMLQIPIAGQPNVEIDEATAFLEFRTEEYLLSHYDKHGIVLGFTSEDEYLNRANQVISSSNVKTTIQDDGDTAYFLEETGEFAVVSSDGFIRTYFVPENGIEYFNRQ